MFYIFLHIVMKNWQKKYNDNIEHWVSDPARSTAPD